MLKLKRGDLLKTQSYINGEWVEAGDCATVPVFNPATGQEITRVASLGAVETRQAIDAANIALVEWRSLTAKQRAHILTKWFQLIMDHADDLATILSFEQGKPLAEAKAEIVYGADYIQWFAEEGKRIYGDIIPHPANDRRVLVIKQAIGVVAAITPWNFPNAMITRKVAPALAAGCTVVCKPATETPLSALALGVLAQDAGIPKGVFNIVVGSKSRDIGGELTSNPLVKKVTFTGSTPVGKVLMAQCATTVKRTSMELGGNAPFIVFDDADIDAAVEGAVISKYRNAGQTCVCSNRIFVQEGVYDAFIEKLRTAVQALKVGNGQEQGVNIGPLVNAKAAQDVQALVADALSKGAVSIIGGKISTLGPCFFEPTILTNVNRDMQVFSQEIFGPVAPVFKFSTEEDAIALANDTEFGLASYFYSRDIGRIWRVSERLEYGMVGINQSIISNEMAPFGGTKESGSGREGSKYGIDDYIEIKYLCMGGLNA